MTDELTTDLAKISALRVISRGSVMQFKGARRRRRRKSRNCSTLMWSWKAPSFASATESE